MVRFDAMFEMVTEIRYAKVNFTTALVLILKYKGKKSQDLLSCFIFFGKPAVTDEKI